MARRTPEHRALLGQLQQIAQGLGETFAPFCEVVVHDLLHPKQAIIAIHNNISGRKVGDPATELGLARIADRDYPAVLANYANQFADGRRAKSTSIGIRDASGRYIAALCVNVDLTLFHALTSTLGEFTRMSDEAAPRESIDPSSADAIRARIDQFAARRSRTPRSLEAKERRALMRELRKSGCLEVRRSMEIVARHLGVSRATVYADAK